MEPLILDGKGVTNPIRQPIHPHTPRPSRECSKEPNVILNGERLKAFPPRIRIKTKMFALPLLFNIVLKVLARAIRQEREIKGIHIGKAEVKSFLFANDMILYMDNLKESTRKPLDLINETSKVSGYKVNITKFNCISIHWQ